MTSKVSEIISPWIERGIEEHGGGERILWESQIQPDEQQTPVIMIVVWMMGGGALGNSVYGSFVLQSPYVDTVIENEQKVVDLLGEFLNQMRAGRSRALAEMSPVANGHNPHPDPAEVPPEPPLPPTRGGQTPGGLWLP